LEGVVMLAQRTVAGDLAAVMRKWPPVADILQMVVDVHFAGLSLPGGASISKAAAICADDQSGPSESQLRKDWATFRDVAHLITAGAVLATEAPENGRSIFAAAWYAPDSLLAIAAGLESFGLSFEPHGQSESILSPKSAWRLPCSCIPGTPWLQNRKLSERQKEVLAAYKSKKSYTRKT
jgi:hypothetical protein